MSTADRKFSAEAGSPCDTCMARRAFLSSATRGTLAMAILGAPGGRLTDWLVREGEAASRIAQTARYAMPAADGVTIDRKEQVILVRHAGHVYAFALACPHQNTALRWMDKEQIFQCPRHKSRYQPDGTFMSGRATRSMDRFAVRKVDAQVEVSFDHVFRQDEDPTGWAAAVVTVGEGGAP